MERVLHRGQPDGGQGRHLAGFITSEGLYFAKLCAAAILAALPVVIAGWVAQNKLVQGLSSGVVK